MNTDYLCYDTLANITYFEFLQTFFVNVGDLVTVWTIK